VNSGERRFFLLHQNPSATDRDCGREILFVLVILLAKLRCTSVAPYSFSVTSFASLLLLISIRRSSGRQRGEPSFTARPWLASVAWGLESGERLGLAVSGRKREPLTWDLVQVSIA
jgi:hypothetical protein